MVTEKVRLEVLFNPLTAKISLVILLAICQMILNYVSLKNLVSDQLVIP